MLGRGVPEASLEYTLSKSPLINRGVVGDHQRTKV